MDKLVFHFQLTPIYFSIYVNHGFNSIEYLEYHLKLP